MIIKHRRHSFTNEPYFTNIRDKKKYRRVVGGIGWPSPKHPGFAVIVAEDLYAGDKYKVRDFRLLEEIESDLPEELLNQMSVLQGVYTKIDWYGDTTNPGMTYLLKLNKELLRKREPKVAVKKPPKFDAPGVYELYAGRVKKRIGQEKTLYFDGCRKAANYILGVADIEKFKEGDSPGFAALMYAVAALDMKDPSEREEVKINRIADRVGGY